MITGDEHKNISPDLDTESAVTQGDAAVEILGDATGFRVAHPIKTGRLQLRIFEESDRDALFGVIGDDVSMRLAGGARDSVRSFNELQAMRRSVLERGWGTLAIEFQGECVGYCGVRPMINTPDVELAYGIRRSLWNQGLATESARAVLQSAFDCLPVGSIVASVYASNAASIRVLEKLGMQFERQVFGIWPHHTALHFRVTRAQFRHGKSG